MPFQEVNRPVHISEAFLREDDGAILSQAAILLVLGSRLRGHATVIHNMTATISPGDTEEDDDLALLGVPHLLPTFGRIDSAGLRERFSKRYGVTLKSTEKVSHKLLHGLATRLISNPEDMGAADLMEACLSHTQEIVRVAAALAHFHRSSEPGRLLEILRQGIGNEDALVSGVAATALGQLSPGDKALQEFSLPGPKRDGNPRPTRTTVLVHGTWAANGSWWQPGGNFFQYLTPTLPPLPRTPPLPPWDPPYGASDYFGWSGGYSDAARAQGGQDLNQWVQAHDPAGVDLITHSHGGNVAFIATQLGMPAKEIVLLSCPVHFPQYLPDFSKVQKAVSVRVRMDLVILADLGGQRFTDPRIEENVLPIWFNHFATHDPAVWRRYNVPQML